MTSQQLKMLMAATLAAPAMLTLETYEQRELVAREAIRFAAMMLTLNEEDFLVEAELQALQMQRARDKVTTLGPTTRVDGLAPTPKGEA
jgi:hypothetical protein